MTKEEAKKSLANTKVYVGEMRDHVIEALYRIGFDRPVGKSHINGLLDPEFLYITGVDFAGGKKLDVFFSHSYKQISMSEILDTQIDEEFKDGDVLASHSGNPFIFNGRYDSRKDPCAYLGITRGGNLKIAELNYTWTSNPIHLATEEESAKLFKALSDAGKRWNAEKKCIEDLPKLFKPFDKVLMRGSSCPNWICCLYSHVEDVQYVACGGTYFTQCISFEGNEHLLGAI